MIRRDILKYNKTTNYEHKKKDKTKRQNIIILKKERKIDLTARICQGLREVKLIMDGQLKAKSMDDLLKELEEFN